MKRGKRQVVELQTGQQKTQQSPTEITNNYFQNISSNIYKSSADQSQIVQTKSLQTTQISEKPFIQQKAKIDDADQKKKKIELLKQKYLKKGKTQDNKPQSSIFQNSNHSTQQQTIQNNPSITEKQQKFQLSIPKPLERQNFPKSNNIYSLNEVTEARKQQSKSIKQAIVQHQNIKIESKQQIHLPIQEKNNQSPIRQQIPKPSSRLPNRNAPPPPPIKKGSTHSPPVITQPYLQNNSLKIQKENVQITKTVSLSPKQQNDKECLLASKSEKQDKTSFAPPSFQTSQSTKIEKKVPNIPPPPNRNMKDILNKKLAPNKPFPKISSRIQEQNNYVNQFNDQSELNQTDLTSKISNNDTNKNNLPLKNKNIEIDDQFNGIQQSNENPTKSNQLEKIEKVDPIKFIGQWLGSPQLTLKQIFPELKQVIQFYCLNKNLSLQITSNNPSFTPLIAQIVQSFIINNTIKYTYDQQKTAQSICLNFFYSNAAQFSDIFLILLVKIGEGYLQKYQKALQDRLEKYLSKLLFYKNLFLPQQIIGFMNFCLEKTMIKQHNFIQFLMLSDCQQLITFITNTEIQNLKYSLGVLSFCKLNLKNKNLVGLYLKSISNIQNQLARYGLVQKILNHIKELDIPQNLYQYAKQLKLRLLKNYGNKQISSESVPNKEQNINSQQNNNKGNKDTGLFGSFNIYKAIDKIKVSTQKALGAVEKNKKPPQQQQKKEQIIYCPIRKRYIINGQIPEDQNTVQDAVQSQIKVKAPPPPPIGGVRKAPPPMHNKKPGARIAVNRYA